MDTSVKTVLVIAFVVVIVLFLLFGGGAMTGAMMSGGMMGSGMMGGISWMWIPALLTLASALRFALGYSPAPDAEAVRRLVGGAGKSVAARVAGRSQGSSVGLVLLATGVRPTISLFAWAAAQHPVQPFAKLRTGYNTRYFDPVLGAFLSPDTLVADAG